MLLRSRKSYILLFALLLTIATVVLTACNARPTHLFVLPQGFTGWVEVTYEQPNAPALKEERNHIVYEVPASGKVATSSANKAGPMVFYYVDAIGQRTGFGTKEQLVHGIGTSSGTDQPPMLRFFVGTEAQFKQQPKEGY
ncbi:DUF6843 domain-containing protein [Paenibacillus koleovorans]|uniref:DUF6843 domain-containing protein n=1 Tax=Paenibacillus koleovorans TaxID=121608 RepID=UPI000FD718EA|nr:hypothetical protein [Paenibacillus koleovorans]